jgi:D-glycero-alpha-D-manno-heptose-7-phosphate kinase
VSVVGGSAVVVARAPLRISLGGGGTDLPSYADRFGGHVVSVAIDRYVTVAAQRRAFAAQVRFASLDGVETVSAADRITDPLRRALLRRAGVERDVQVVTLSDVPAGVGLGGSAAFAVAILSALAPDGPPSPRWLAEQASAVEMVDLRRPVGRQDHYIAAYGGVRSFRITPAGVTVEPLYVGPAALAAIDRGLLLFYSGQQRDAGHVLQAQHTRAAQSDRSVLSRLHRIKEIATEVAAAVATGDVPALGGLLDEHWRLKRTLGPGVSTPWTDTLYQRALDAGAAGGKILGAGGGGFLLLAVPADRLSAVRVVLTDAGCTELSFSLPAIPSRVVAPLG